MKFGNIIVLLLLYHQSVVCSGDPDNFRGRFGKDIENEHENNVNRDRVGNLWSQKSFIRYTTITNANGVEVREYKTEYTNSLVRALFWRVFRGWEPGEVNEEQCKAACQVNSCQSQAKFIVASDSDYPYICRCSSIVSGNDDDDLCGENAVCLNEVCTCQAGLLRDGYEGCYACRTDNYNDCDGDEFCNANSGGILECVKKLPNGANCTGDNQCQSGNCPNSEHCDAATCRNDSDCAGDEFCEFPECVKKKEIGLVCHFGDECESGYCFIGFCSGCPYYWMDEGCPEDQFCDGWSKNCVDKVGVGEFCWADAACRTGKCNYCGSVVCSADPHCGSGDCIGMCESPNRPTGSSCDFHDECESRYCLTGVCTECPESDSEEGCPYKLGLGKNCLSDADCKSGICNMVCESPNLPIGSPCDYNVECESGYCSSGSCTRSMP